jgi:hypothetical protein
MPTHLVALHDLCDVSEIQQVTKDKHSWELTTINANRIYFVELALKQLF